MVNNNNTDDTDSLDDLEEEDFYDGDDGDIFDLYEDELNIIYEPDDPNRTDFTIVLCELYNEYLHGENEDVTQYLVAYRFKEFDEIASGYIYSIANVLKSSYLNLLNQNHPIKNHRVYRNYRQIITSENYIKPEIAKCIYLDTGHCVAILKTFWLRLIQRKWRNIMKERKEMIHRRCQFSAIRERELTGRWPRDCAILPTLEGMLSTLNNPIMK